ncbi:MAG: UDP-3-O-(3-hydroxymyristoyl)glucosamine N-acyltransferase [Phycisphaeraceae bacterium]
MPITLQDLAKDLDAKLVGDGSRRIARCAALDQAQPEDLALLSDSDDRAALKRSKAGAVIVSPDHAKPLNGLALLVCDNPLYAFRQALVKLHGFRPHPAPGISPQAYVDQTAVVGELCTIRPFVYIAPRANIGRRVVIYPNSYIGKDAVIGDDTVIYSNVTVYDRTEIGRRVIIHAGSAIGQDAGDYAEHDHAYHKLPSLGRAIVEDDVELGANAAVQRSTLGATVIGAGSKLGDGVIITRDTRIAPHSFVKQVKSEK